MDTHGNLRKPMETHGNPWKPMETQGAAKSSYPPIAPPRNRPSSSEDQDEDQEISEELSEEEISSQELSGKELDLFYRRGLSGAGGDGDDVDGIGGGGGGGGSGGGPGVHGRERQNTRGVAAGMTSSGLPAERTSYMFCPAAHGMMRFVVRTYVRTYCCWYGVVLCCGQQCVCVCECTV